MWMAAGFAMLEAGLVRSKNTTEILTKNIVLFAIACTMYMVVGYDIMYGGGILLDGLAADGVAGAEEPAGYAPSADFYFQVVFVATAMSIVSGAVAERMNQARLNAARARERSQLGAAERREAHRPCAAGLPPGVRLLLPDVDRPSRRRARCPRLFLLLSSRSRDLSS